MPTLTAEALAPLRPRLIAFCYQMLGSPFDAEDAVQDVMERAWRSRDSYDAALASVSTWCYRIAHNVCVDRLRGTPRRPLPRDLRDPGIEIGAPLVPALDVPWLMPAPSSWIATSEVGTAIERATDMRLAVTALLQTLPARQRGAFVLREVLGLSAAETATVLQTSVSAVNSALQRARSTLGDAARPASAGGLIEAEQVERYARAIERADVETLAALVADDVILEMPPVAEWSRGRQPYLEFMAHLFSWRGSNWQTSPVKGNGQCGLLLYLVGPGARSRTRCSSSPPTKPARSATCSCTGTRGCSRSSNLWAANLWAAMSRGVLLRNNWRPPSFFVEGPHPWADSSSSNSSHSTGS